MQRKEDKRRTLDQEKSTSKILQTNSNNNIKKYMYFSRTPLIVKYTLVFPSLTSYHIGLASCPAPPWSYLLEWMIAKCGRSPGQQKRAGAGQEKDREKNKDKWWCNNSDLANEYHQHQVSLKSPKCCYTSYTGQKSSYKEQQGQVQWGVYVKDKVTYM